MADKKVRIGLAGYGFSGRFFHAPFIAVDSRFELKKVLQRNADTAKEDFPDTEVVRTFEELLTDDIDLVVLAVPHKLHYEMAEKAILAGKNVVVEKPFTPTEAEARKLCALAKEKGVLLSVYQSRRYDGDFLTVKKLLSEGKLGDVTDYECRWERYAKFGAGKPWKMEQVPGNGAFYNLGVHILDQAYTLFGMPDEIYAEFRKLREVNAFPDNFRVVFYYPDKIATISASETSAAPAPHFTIHGNKGSFTKYGLDGQEAALCAGRKPADGNWGVEPESMYGIFTGVETGEKQVIPTENGNCGYFYDNIYRALREGAELEVRPEQAADVLKIMDAALLSNAEKRRIAVK